METRHLNEFVHLSRTLSFRETARQLSISQSTLSRHISSLEAEIGTTLFMRDSQSVELTEEGRVMVKASEEALGAIDRAVLSVRDSYSPSGNVRIGGATRVNKVHSMLSRAMLCFGRAFPNVTTELRDTEFHDYRDDLRRGSLDVAFSMHYPQMDMSGIDYVDMFETRLCVWLSREDPLAFRSEVGVHELSGYQLRLLYMKGRPMQMENTLKIFASRDIALMTGRKLDRTYTLYPGEFCGLAPSLEEMSLQTSGLVSVPVSGLEPIRLCVAKASFLKAGPAMALYESIARRTELV